MSKMTGIINLILLCSALLTAGLAKAADSVGEPGRSAGEKNPLNNVYFGEQHLHTANSPDAFAMGTRNSPDDAYNFCKGKAIKNAIEGIFYADKRAAKVGVIEDSALSVLIGEQKKILNQHSWLIDTTASSMIIAPIPTKTGVFVSWSA